jgi:hypothetical protein
MEVQVPGYGQQLAGTAECKILLFWHVTYVSNAEFCVFCCCGVAAFYLAGTMIG